MKRVLIIAVMLAGCGDPPPLTLKFAVTAGDVQACTSSTGTKASSCSDVTMLCDAVVSIRIFAPSDPSAPFISVCKPLAKSANNRNLCAIAGVDLTQPEMPITAQTLEVDMTVYPLAKLATDDAGNYLCPADVAFGADGFPIAATVPCDDPDPMICPAQPAIGGRAFFHPGDTETIVSLGCTNLGALEDRTCAGQNALAVTASVNDFDTSVSVSPATADGLTVSVGEPASNGSVFTLPPAQAHALDRSVVGPVPAWSGDFDLQLHNAACLDVLEDGAQSTAVLTCTDKIAPNPLDLPGVRLSTATLNEILGALRTRFPSIDLANGLVVGIALDYTGKPLDGVTIVPSSGTVVYLSADRHSLIPALQPQATSTSGVFVSTDAPFGTSFTPTGVTVQAQPGFGGLVAQKVNVVVIQFKPPGTGG